MQYKHPDNDPQYDDWYPSEEELKKARPAIEVDPELVAAYRRGDLKRPPHIFNKSGRPPIANPKKPISLRLDPDIIEAMRKTGKGWQSRVNDVLRTTFITNHK